MHYCALWGLWTLRKAKVHLEILVTILEFLKNPGTKIPRMRCAIWGFRYTLATYGCDNSLNFFITKLV